MALFKPYKGNRTGLSSVAKKDGNAYFCTDDGSFWIDYTDSNGALQRKQISASEAETLGGKTVDEIIAMIPNVDSKISTHNQSTSAHSDIRTLANNAQSAANTAQGAADAAQSTADQAVSDAAKAQEKADAAYDLAGTKANSSDVSAHTGDTNNPHGVTITQIGAASATDLTSHTGNKSNPHGVTKSQVGLGNVPNVATNNQTPTYTAASSLSALTSGEKLSVAFGKLAKSVSSQIEHLADTSNPHGVTAAQIGAAVSGHNHNDTYYTETEIDTKLTAINVSIADITSGSTTVAKAEKATHAASADSADSATTATTATTASALATARTISLGGDASGSVSFDGSKNVTLTVAVTDDSHNHIISNVDGLQSALDNKADADHAHDDIYYTEAEIDTKLSGKSDTSHTHTVAKITDLTATATELNYMDGVTSNVQAQFDALTTAVSGKAASSHSHTITAGASDDDVVILSGTNGTNKVTYSASHATSGVTAGTYKSVTVNEYGHVTSGTNPTTLADYGITDAATSGELSALTATVSGKAPTSHASTGTGYGIGTGSNYGHVKLSDSTSSTSAASSGVAASPKAVKSAYDAATNAATAATNAATAAAEAKAAADAAQTTADGAQSRADNAYALAESKVDSLSDLGITATAAELNYVDGVTSNIQTQLNNKASQSVVTTSANGLMAATDKAKLDVTNIAYGTCSTAAATAAKVITVSGNAQWSLAAGSMITVLFSATNTASNPTFNVNGTGAKNVYYTSSQITTSNLSYAGYKNRPMTFMYDGTQYRFIGWGIDNNSDTKVTQAAAITTEGEYPVILGYSTSTSSVTNTVNKTSTLKYNPSTQVLTAPTFSGNLTGNATTATSATSATKAAQDASGNVIASTYETKADASAKLSTAKAYADEVATQVKNDLLNGAGEAYDTLKELSDLIVTNVDAIDALEDIAASKANASDLTSHTGNKSNPHGVTLSQLGVTATAAELNVLDGITATTQELNYVDGVTSNIQTQLNGKAAASHGTHVTYSDTAPVMDGTAAVGSASTVARSDHVHPTDTSRAAKADFDSHTTNTTAHITSTERTNWGTAYTHSQAAHAPSNAEKNQNAFSNITVGSTTVAADSATDTVTFVGSNVTITPDATNDKITFAVASGSTSTAGIVKLTNSTSSTSTTTAATPNSVKSAYDLASSAKTVADAAQLAASAAQETADGKADAEHTHTVSHTPAGTVSQPTFTGSAVTSGKPSASSTVASSTHTHKYTPAGTVSAPTFTGVEAMLSADYTPAGSVSTPTFTGSAAPSGAPSASATVASGTHTHEYTPAGTVSQPTFTGSSATSGKPSVTVTVASNTHTHEYTPAGTISQPTFTGSATTSGGPSASATVYSITDVGTLPSHSYTAPSHSYTAPSLTAAISNRCMVVTFSAGSHSFNAGSHSFSAGTLPTKGSGVSVATGSHTHSVTATGTVSQPTFIGIEASTTSIEGTTSVAGSAHTHSVTAKGTVSQPTFTGTEASTTSIEGTTSVATGAHTHSVTAKGSISQPTFTGTEATISIDYTPAGVVSQPTFTGTEASTTSISGTTSVAGSAHTHSVTAVGTVSKPTFTGTAAALTTSVEITSDES